MSLFNIDYNILIENLLPDWLRKPRMKAFVRVLISPVISLYGKFYMNRINNLYRVQHGQYVAHIESVLNDVFDSGLRRIVVEDSPEDYNPVPIYREMEEKPVFLHPSSENQPVALYTYEEILFAGSDFVVKVPATIPVNMEQMKALINFYKMPGKGYSIEFI